MLYDRLWQAFLFLIIFCITENVYSVRYVEFVETIRIYDCEYVFIWFNIRPPDDDTLDLRSHIETCTSNSTANLTKYPHLEFDLIGFKKFKFYISNFQFNLITKNQSIVPTKFFFLKESILNMNTLVRWSPFRRLKYKNNIKLELLNPHDQSALYQPQNILCYAEQCHFPTRPPQSKTSTRTTKNARLPLENSTSKEEDANIMSMRIYQMLAACAGAVSILLSCMVLLLLVCYRRSLNDREKIQQRLDQMIRSQQAKEQPPIYGNISRRRSLYNAKKSEAPSPSPSHQATTKRPPFQKHQYYTCSGLQDGTGTTRTLLNGHSNREINNCSDFKS